MSCNHAHINFKFQPKKDGEPLLLFFQVFCLENKDIVNPE
jgi:hypothetical protein